MSFNQNEYIKKYQKEKYKMFAFRVRNDDEELLNKLKNIENKNEYIIDLLRNDKQPPDGVLTLKELKLIIKPILNKRNINEIYLFGSYARGEANKNSDVDIYCEKGNIKNLYDVVDVNEELKKALNKNVDIVFTSSVLEKTFENSIKRDLIKLC